MAILILISTVKSSRWMLIHFYADALVLRDHLQLDLAPNLVAALPNAAHAPYWWATLQFAHANYPFPLWKPGDHDHRRIVGKRRSPLGSLAGSRCAPMQGIVRRGKIMNAALLKGESDPEVTKNRCRNEWQYLPLRHIPHQLPLKQR